MTTTNQAMLFYIVLLIIFYYIGYTYIAASSPQEKYVNATIGAVASLLLSAFLYKYNRLTFTE